MLRVTDAAVCASHKVCPRQRSDSEHCCPRGRQDSHTSVVHVCAARQGRALRPLQRAGLSGPGRQHNHRRAASHAHVWRVAAASVLAVRRACACPRQSGAAPLPHHHTMASAVIYPLGSCVVRVCWRLPRVCGAAVGTPCDDGALLSRSCALRCASPEQRCTHVGSSVSSCSMRVLVGVSCHGGGTQPASGVLRATAVATTRRTFRHWDGASAGHAHRHACITNTLARSDTLHQSTHLSIQSVLPAPPITRLIHFP
jgi:hypothetical protein